MKIAAVTENGDTISQHFGRAPYYAVLTIEDGKVISRELKDKLGHREFVTQEVGEDPQMPHGFGPGAQDRHSRMALSIADCQVLLCGGMGQGAYQSMRERGIETIVTDIQDIDSAVQAYLDGTIINYMDRVH